jgi:hypothetical protein
MVLPRWPDDASGRLLDGDLLKESSDTYFSTREGQT